MNWLKRLLGYARDDVPSNDLNTEFACEVVYISDVRPHPNADRLDLVRFKMKSSGHQEAGYEVVVGRGEYGVGQLATYISVDCVVPLDREPFAFLAKRPDAQGKQHLRIRAARIRGVYSQGLIVPVAYDEERGVFLNYGDRADRILGVTYHRPPEPGVPSQPRPPRPQPAPVYGVLSLKKAPHTFVPGEEVHITEKVHGTNYRFGWVRRRFLGIPVGWRFFVGSHQVEKGRGAPGFYGDDVWAEYARQRGLREATRAVPGLVFYGELYGYTTTGKRIQDMTYGLAPNQTGLVVFDVRDTRRGRWLTLAERKDLLDIVGLVAPPSLGTYPWSPGLAADLAEGPSLLHSGTVREGVVVEALQREEHLKAKFVGQGYLLRREAA